MQAVLYLRVSTEEQTKHGVSLADQEERLKAYCAARGLKIIAILREGGISGGKPIGSRPQGAKLFELLQSGVKHVVALKLDRLFRNALDALQTVDYWNKLDIRLHLVDMGGSALDSGTAVGRMMLVMLAGTAEMERNLTQERVKSALDHKKKHGQAYGPTPYGFIRAGKALRPDPEEQKVLTRIKRRRAAGAGYRAISRELNADGIKAKNGGIWHDTTVRYILQNGLHEGVIEA